MKLLHLEDSDLDAELIGRMVTGGWPGCAIQRVRSRTEYQQALEGCGYDVILADHALSDYDGTAAFDFAREHCPDVPFIFMSGAIGEEKAVEAMKRGAADYVMKDRPARLVPAIRQALVLAGEKRLRRQKEAEAVATARLAELLVQIASGLFVGAAEAAALEQTWRMIVGAVRADAYACTALSDATHSESPGTEGRFDPALLGVFGVPTLAESIGRGGETDRMLSTADLQQTDPTVGRALHDRGIRWLSSHVLQAGGRALGVLALAFRRHERLTLVETRFLRTATDLVAAHLERNRLLGEVRGALLVAEQANRAKDDFLAALSHELRTPLNPALLLATDAAAKPELPPEVRADFATIARHVTLEARLIDDLLDFTRMARNEFALTFSEASVHAILREAWRVTAPQAEAKQLTVEWRLAAHADVGRVDAGRLQQALWILLANAIKFTPARGRIHVQTSCAADDALIMEIHDSGIGLTPQEIQRVFDPFVRGDHAAGRSAEYTGLGLGLAIARKIIELHGGKLRASSPGRGLGSTFTLELPPVRRSASSGETEASTASAEVQPGASLLLVEDHESTRRALAGLLTRRAHRVVTAGTVSEARRIAAENRFDLVLCDIGLPDGNGHELMADLHRNHGLRGIALTGFRIEPDDPDFQRAGFVSLLTKPVAIGPLTEAIANALPKPG